MKQGESLRVNSWGGRPLKPCKSGLGRFWGNPLADER